RNPRTPAVVEPKPTTTEPLAETPSACDPKPPPGRSPRPTMPVAAVQRKAESPEGLSACPTATEPSKLTASASASPARPRVPRSRAATPPAVSQRTAWSVASYQVLAQPI